MTVKINICNVLDMPKYAISHNKIKLQVLETSSYFNFIQAHTIETRRTYRYYFSNYLRFNQIKDSDVLLQKTPKEIEQNLIKYIMHLKESGLAPNTIYYACASIFSFYEMNDIDLRKRKIKKYIGELRKIHKGVVRNLPPYYSEGNYPIRAEMESEDEGLGGLFRMTKT